MLGRWLIFCAIVALAAPALAQPVETSGAWSDSYDGKPTTPDPDIAKPGQCYWHFADSTGTRTDPPIISIATTHASVTFDNDVTAAQGAGVSATATVQVCQSRISTSCIEADDPPIVLTGNVGSAGVADISARFLRVVISPGSSLCAFQVCGGN
jgi:hypothetical protein